MGNLKQNKIGDVGGTALGEALKTNTTIKIINLNSEIQVTKLRDGYMYLTHQSKEYNDIDIIVIASLVRMNTILTILNLEENKIGDVGGTALGEALKINST